MAHEILDDLEAVIQSTIAPRPIGSTGMAVDRWVRERAAEWESAGCDNSVWGATPTEVLKNLRASLAAAINVVP